MKHRLLLALSLTLAGLGLARGEAMGARPVPPREAGAERALFLDLEKIVDSRARFEWVADRIEAEAAARQALRSLCLVEAPARGRLRVWLASEITASGGPAAGQFAAGTPVGDLTEVMRLERVRAIMDVVEPRVPGECGFWAQATPDFSGVQTDAHRFVLLLETNGGGQIYLGRSPLTFGGAGTGRLLAGYGLSDRFTLAAGAELGGASTFPRDKVTGTRSVQAGFLGGVPMLLRYARSTFLADTDLAMTARAPEDNLEGWQYGFRVMQGIGTSEPRIGDFMGYLLFTVGYEIVPGNVQHDTAHILRIGTRLGIDWDP